MFSSRGSQLFYLLICKTFYSADIKKENMAVHNIRLTINLHSLKKYKNMLQLDEELSQVTTDALRSVWGYILCSCHVVKRRIFSSNRWFVFALCAGEE